MIKILNENYYIDLDVLDKQLQIENSSGETQIHIVKYEVVKMLLDTILAEVEEVDEKLGPNNSDLTIPFKLSFNTLLVNKIINKF
jgi:uncharacterized protein related to proFAR isomerase